MKLINADKVIETLKTRKKLFCRNQIEFRMLSPDQKSRVDEIDTCIAELVNAEEVQTTDTDSDTISRAKAIDAIDSFNVFESRGDQIKLEQMIGELPHAQPERIRGRWIAKEKKNLFRCSKCDAVIYSESEYDRDEFHKFCGRCGADMREVTT